MFKSQKKTKVHIAQFEQDQRRATISMEFDAAHEKKLNWILLFLKILLFPVIFPLKAIWFFLKNIINE